MPKYAPAPIVDSSTWRALLLLAEPLEKFAPWEFASDVDCVGLEDADDGDYRLAHVLGNAGEVFAAVLYRRRGIAWLLKALSEDLDPHDFSALEEMDCLKVEFVPRRELAKEDLAVLKTAGLKPAGKGRLWPQFRSTIPGWHPWHIDQAEADQLLRDLPRLTAFLKLLKSNPSLFEERSDGELPFLPASLPGRPLALDDLNWRKCIRLPDPPLSPYVPPQSEMDPLRSLPRTRQLVVEFDSALMPGASFRENGRPCFGRVALLVESVNGIVIGGKASSGAMHPGDAAGAALVSLLRQAPVLPSMLVLRNPRWRPVVEGVCGALGIEVRMAKRLPALDEALAHLERSMADGGSGL
ncbi:MAG: hypothetical protein KF791_20810 [Verrucomicrobiae bacterium]|nr:hypothetical protein [Verrucomicrobiae bacterium]